MYLKLGFNKPIELIMAVRLNRYDFEFKEIELVDLIATKNLGFEQVIVGKKLTVKIPDEEPQIVYIDTEEEKFLEYVIDKNEYPTFKDIYKIVTTYRGGKGYKVVHRRMARLMETLYDLGYNADGVYEDENYQLVIKVDNEDDALADDVVEAVSDLRSMYGNTFIRLTTKEKELTIQIGLSPSIDKHSKLARDYFIDLLYSRLKSR